MVTLHEGGVYLINGTTLVDCDGQEADAVLKETGAAVSQKEAAKKYNRIWNFSKP